MGGYLGKSVGGFTSVTEKRQTFNITTTTTQLTGLSYTPTKEEVHVNGIRYVRDVDYTANDGLTVTMTNPLLNGDTAIVKSFPSFDVADTVSASNGGTFAGNVQMSGNATVGGTLGVTGNSTLGGTLGVTGNSTLGGTLDVAGVTTITGDLNVDTNTLHVDATNNRVGIGSAAPLRQLSIANTSSAEMSFISGTSSNASILFGDGTTGTDVYRGYIQYEHTNDAMTFATNAVESMRIHEDGYITYPNQPAFYMQNTTSGSIYSGGNVRINRGNHWNNTTGSFTAPVAGAYQFGAYGQSLNSPFYIIGYHSGTGVAAWYDTSGSGYKHAAMTFIVNMAANDSVYITGSGINTGGQNGMFGHFLG